jgi:hypothetical protein
MSPAHHLSFGIGMIICVCMCLSHQESPHARYEAVDVCIIPVEIQPQTLTPTY